MGAAALTGPDPDELAARLRVAVNRLQRRLRRESLGDLSPAQASTLGSVSRLGAPTLSELAAAEQVQPPTMTRIVSSLVDSGMVVREIDACDRRSARVRVTPAGDGALERVRRRRDAFLRDRMSQLEPAEEGHLGALVALLEHLVEER